MGWVMNCSVIGTAVTTATGLVQSPMHPACAVWGIQRLRGALWEAFRAISNAVARRHRPRYDRVRTRPAGRPRVASGQQQIIEARRDTWPYGRGGRRQRSESVPAETARDPTPRQATASPTPRALPRIDGR